VATKRTSGTCACASRATTPVETVAVTNAVTRSAVLRTRYGIRTFSASPMTCSA
jgi:hypothetical protein